MSETKEKKPLWQSDRDSTLNGFNAALPEGLFNDRDTKVRIKAEKPVHRRITELSIQGFNNKEIAAMVGMDSRYVSDVLRQPYARMHIVEAAKRTVQDELKEFLDKELMPSLQVIKAVRDNELLDPKDRMAAADKLVNRRLGNPTQPISHNQKPATELTKEELDAEVAALLAQNG